MSDSIEGGCLCGNIRFQTTKEPSYQLLCYCTDCQTISGAANFAAYGVTIESIVNSPQFARYLSVIQNDYKRGIYEQEALYRRIQD